MTTPLERSATYAQDMVKFLSEQTSAFGTRIATWLVVGNAGGLVITFNAIMAGTSCSQAVLLAVVKIFALGLGLAFVGSLFAYGGSITGMAAIARQANIITKVFTNDHYERELAANNIPAPASFALTEDEVRTLHSRRGFYLTAGFAALAIALYLASAVQFGRALLLPVTSPAAAFKTCDKQLVNGGGTPAAKLGVKPSEAR